MTLKPGKILPHVKTDGYGGILPATLAKELRDRVGKPFVIDASSYEERVLIDLQLPEGVLSVVAPGERLFSSTTYIFILWMVGTLLALFAVASIFMRNQVRPILRLAAAADRFGKGRDIDEIGRASCRERVCQYV